ncbi:MAG TPA: HDIG domain-containing protein, partial [Candidatus Binatia bacterium]|nr:HDIG domain-containing protein [Candidatus Binatia bacterium]
MLTQRPSRSIPFTRHDAGRLFVAATLLIVALVAIFAVDIVPSGLGLAVGQIPKDDVVAPRTIQFTSDLQTEAAREAASAAVPPQYDYTIAQGAAVADQQAAAFATDVAPVDAAFDASVTAAQRAELLKSVLPDLTEAGRTTLEGLTSASWKATRDEAARVLDVIERPELRDSDVATVRAGLASRFLGTLTPDQKSLAAELIAPLLVPNSSFSQALTDQMKTAAAQGVRPVTVEIQQGEIIADKGHPISADEMEKIDAFDLNVPTLDLARLSGFVLLAVLLVGLLLAWVWRFRPTLWHRNNVLVLLGFIIVVATFALKLTAGRNVLPYVLPTAAAGILVAILLDASLAMVLMAILGVIAGAVNGDSLEMATYVFLGGFAGIVAVRRGDRLNAFVQAGIAIAIVGAAVISVFSLLGGRDLTAILQLYGASILAGAGAAVAAVGSFAVLGNVFGILTVFQMLELANPSQPLLRRLLVETPGTYHHSIMVGNLAERAAEAIGADPLLTRVAAYYHDIGKLANPAAFIENQAGGDNIHDGLDPYMSAQLVKQHVADGIELAYRSKLPKTLIAFIPQHHGTAVMSYFYARAREEAAAPFGGIDTPDGAAAAAAVDIRRFRHAGPKPQSREAALIMLADKVEASVRSLAARDEPAIQTMVSRIIEKQLSDGQFDECNLTLRDVELVREAFVQQLLGMYHQRI